MRLPETRTKRAFRAMGWGRTGPRIVEVANTPETGSARGSLARPAVSQGVATIQRQGRTLYALCLLTSDVR
ncbi:hypothetical protein D3C85_782200 [compost metagenome]